MRNRQQIEIESTGLSHIGEIEASNLIEYDIVRPFKVPPAPSPYNALTVPLPRFDALDAPADIIVRLHHWPHCSRSFAVPLRPPLLQT